MDFNTSDIVEQIMHSEAIRPEDIPNIGLYMDQITTFLEEKLAASRRYPDDKIMTKTMVNNYTKARLLPPSDRKKYSREHVLILIMIYYMKNVLSISDIQTMMEPLTGKYFPSDKESGISVSNIYQSTLDSILDNRENMEKELSDLWTETSKIFDTEGLPEEEGLYLDGLAYIYRLSYDIYIRKQLIERLIDEYRRSLPDGKKGKEKKPSRKAH